MHLSLPFSRFDVSWPEPRYTSNTSKQQGTISSEGGSPVAELVALQSVIHVEAIFHSSRLFVHQAKSVVGSNPHVIVCVLHYRCDTHVGKTIVLSHHLCCSISQSTSH